MGSSPRLCGSRGLPVRSPLSRSYSGRSCEDGWAIYCIPWTAEDANLGRSEGDGGFGILVVPWRGRAAHRRGQELGKLRAAQEGPQPPPPPPLRVWGAAAPPSSPVEASGSCLQATASGQARKFVESSVLSAALCLSRCCARLRRAHLLPPSQKSLGPASSFMAEHARVRPAKGAPYDSPSCLVITPGPEPAASLLGHFGDLRRKWPGAPKGSSTGST